MHELRNHLYTCTAGLFETNSESEGNDDNMLQQHELGYEVIINDVSSHAIITQDNAEPEITFTTPLVSENGENISVDSPIIIDTDNTETNNEIETATIQNINQGDKI